MPILLMPGVGAICARFTGKHLLINTDRKGAWGPSRRCSCLESSFPHSAKQAGTLSTVGV